MWELQRGFITQATALKLDFVFMGVQYSVRVLFLNVIFSFSERGKKVVEFYICLINQITTIGKICSKSFSVRLNQVEF